MKTRDVPQQPENSMLAGYQRACYAVDDQGRYVVVGSVGWEVENVVNAQANDEVRAQIAAALAQARRGETSPLAYHMARRQMDPGMLAAYAGFSRLRIRWHLRPGVFARLPERILRRYADALKLPLAELRALPAEDDHERL
jgi:hypothetical protein